MILEHAAHAAGTIATLTLTGFVGVLLVTGAVKDVRALPLAEQAKRKAFYLAALLGAALAFIIVTLFFNDFLIDFAYYKERIPVFIWGEGLKWVK